jgi:hypothetical protein
MPDSAGHGQHAEALVAQCLETILQAGHHRTDIHDGSIRLLGG